jgi:hypothetical protein
VTLLRQESIHPSYQAEKKQVRKPSTEDRATGELREAKRNNQGKGRKVLTTRAADGKA